MSINIQKKQLMDLATDFNGFVVNNKWVYRYDTESDALSVTKSKLSNDARIKYFDDEVAFYITDDNKIEGIFVEYFKSNFLKHHINSKKIEKVLNRLEEEQKNDEALISVDIKKAKQISPDLQEAIKNSITNRLDLSLNC